MRNNQTKTFTAIGCILLITFRIYRTVPTRYAPNISNKSGLKNSGNSDIKRQRQCSTEDGIPTNTIRRPINDFVTFPCVPKYNVTSLLEHDRCVRTVNVDLLAKNVQDYECVDLHLNAKLKICVYDPRKDAYVSKVFFDKGVWEKTQVDQFGIAMNKHKVTDVLDLGSYIGIYTIKAALMGKRVVALDANIENHRLLAKSLVLNNIRDRVTLIWNAISDVYRNVTVNVAFGVRNIGSSNVRTVNKNTVLSKDTVLVETIKLDDLENMFRNKVVAIKMDVEGCELMALKGGICFLKNIDIRLMQMEIGQHTKTTRGEQIVSIMGAYGFTGYRDCLGRGSLKYVPVKSWPWDVCFMK